MMVLLDVKSRREVAHSAASGDSPGTLFTARYAQQKCRLRLPWDCQLCNWFRNWIKIKITTARTL